MNAARAALVATVSLLLAGATSAIAGPSPNTSNPAPIWDGFYLGAHGGYAQTSGDDSGGLFGVHGGYRRSFGTMILGVEADVTGTGIEQSVTASGNGITATATASLDYLASVRAVGGVEIGRAFLYATGGLGLGGASFKVAASGFGTSASGELSASLTGSVFGAGLEVRASDKISVRGEVLHYAFSRATIDGVTVSGDLAVTTVRAGLSMRLN